MNNSNNENTNISDDLNAYKMKGCVLNSWVVFLTTSVGAKGFSFLKGLIGYLLIIWGHYKLRTLKNYYRKLVPL